MAPARKILAVVGARPNLVKVAPILRALARHLTDGGVFALWSDDPPDDDFMVTLSSVFSEARAHLVDFDNPLTGGMSSNTVYVAR